MKNATTTATETPRVSKKLLTAMALVLVAFGVYANSLKGEFVWDDTTLFIEHAHLWQWENIWQLLTTQDNLFKYNSTGFYRPLISVTFLLDRWLWGSIPVGYHLTNILFHILATLTVFGIANRRFKDVRIGAAAGLFFALHPIHTEAVSWVTGRNNLVAIVFYLLAFYCYLIDREQPQKRYLAFAMGALTLSMFSKEYALTFPLMVLLCEVSMVTTRSAAGIQVKRLAIYAVSCLGVFVTYGTIRAMVLPNGAGLGFQIAELGSRLLMLPKILLFYIKLLVLPIRLTPFHSLASVEQTGGPGIVWPAVALVALIVLWIGSFKWSRDVFFSFGWILVALLPVLQIIPIPYAASPVSERHLYLPSVGFCLLLSWICLVAVRSIASRSSRVVRFLPLVLVLLISEFYCFETVKRNLVWRNALTLWQDTALKSPDDYRIQSNLAIAYGHRKRWAEGRAAAETAVRLSPHQDTPHFILGTICLKQGDLDQAADAFQDALKINPGHKDAAALLKRVKALETRRNTK